MRAFTVSKIPTRRRARRDRDRPPGENGLNSALINPMAVATDVPKTGFKRAPAMGFTPSGLPILLDQTKKGFGDRFIRNGVEKLVKAALEPKIEGTIRLLLGFGILGLLPLRNAATCATSCLSHIGIQSRGALPREPQRLHNSTYATTIRGYATGAQLRAMSLRQAIRQGKP